MRTTLPIRPHRAAALRCSPETHLALSDVRTLRVRLMCIWRYIDFFLSSQLCVAASHCEPTVPSKTPLIGINATAEEGREGRCGADRYVRCNGCIGSKTSYAPQRDGARGDPQGAVHRKSQGRGRRHG
jgi:hypothetical protein